MVETKVKATIRGRDVAEKEKWKSYAFKGFIQ